MELLEEDKMIKWMKNFLITNSTFYAVWMLAIILIAGVTSLCVLLNLFLNS